MAIPNLAMATGNLGRPARCDPAARPDNVQGACDMASFPPRSSAANRPCLRRCPTAPCSNRCGAARSNKEFRASVSPTCSIAAVPMARSGPLPFQGGHPCILDPHPSRLLPGSRRGVRGGPRTCFLHAPANYAHVSCRASTFLEKNALQQRGADPAVLLEGDGFALGVETGRSPSRSVQRAG